MAPFAPLTTHNGLNLFIKGWNVAFSPIANVWDIFLFYLCYSIIKIAFRKNRSVFFVSFFVPTFLYQQKCHFSDQKVSKHKVYC